MLLHFRTSTSERYLSLEDCTSQQCHYSSMSKVDQAMCALQCVLKTSPGAGDGMMDDLDNIQESFDRKVDLSDRQVDPIQACAEAKCLNVVDYHTCIIEECVAGRRSVREQDGPNDDADDMWGRIFSRRDTDHPVVLQTRSKRPVATCLDCNPTSSGIWPDCRAQCSGK